MKNITKKMEEKIKKIKNKNKKTKKEKDPLQDIKNLFQMIFQKLIKLIHPW